MSMAAGDGSVQDPWDVPAMPFVDFTASGSTLDQYSRKTSVKGYALGFVAVKPENLVPSWGAYKEYSAIDGKYKKDEVAKFKGDGGVPVISFGGAANYLPETLIKDEKKLHDYYCEIINAYDINHVDFNIEGQSKTDEARDRNVTLVSKLVNEKSTLKISYTLQIKIGQGVDDSGLDNWSVELLKKLADLKIKIVPSLVNPLTMYMWQPSEDQWLLAKRVLQGTNKQLYNLYNLIEKDAWRRIGCCPMYGDSNGHGYWTKDNQKLLCQFAKDNNLGCVSGWNANTDIAKFNGDYEKVCPTGRS